MDVISQVDRLNVLLDQLLQLARIESSNVIANRVPICLSHIISASIEKWKKIAEGKAINVYRDIPEDAIVTGDKLFLELILDNLLTNAVKYGQENGSVYLIWNDIMKTLSVKDDGIGISAEELPNIFNRFYRADESRSSAVKGNGLGLSIAIKLADLQFITLSAESHPGLGSTFTLQFPN